MNLNRLIAAAVVVVSTGAFAAGFRIDTQHARATGMGGAVSALVDDPSAVYYNPAGIAQGKGLRLSAGISLILPSVSFKNAETGESSGTVFAVSPPPNFYVTYGITEDLSVGLGVFTPFGAAGNWPLDWQGRFKAQRSNVQTFNFNPEVAYRIHPRLRLGVGFQVLRGTVSIQRALNFVDSEGGVTLGGATWGFGFNLGVQAELIEKTLIFGASFRSGSAMAFTGRAHFTNVPVEFQSRLADQGITADIALPHVAQFGLAYLPPVKGLKLGLDFTFTGWSSFPELAIKFENPDITVPLAKRWADTVSVHVGGEYDINDAFSVRLGFVYDPTPSPKDTLTPDLPDATRIKVCAGFGWRSTFGLNADLGYQFVALLPQESTAPGFAGTYSGTAQVIGLNVGYKL